MKLWIFALEVSAILLISGCSQAENANLNNAPAASGSPATLAMATPDEHGFARANYAKHCFACHGDEGKGGLVKVEDVRLKVPSLTEGHALEHSDEKFFKQITDGGEGMPKFEDKLSAAEINALVRFIRREFQGKSEK
ncbi:MAG TPA: cytochrome c [Pyrinomonadaceae bacterium]|nr:cytochrome c [Pyrinomonadaceae bacterium]